MSMRRIVNDARAGRRSFSGRCRRSCPEAGTLRSTRCALAIWRRRPRPRRTRCAFANRGSVLLRGQRYPIAGAICMDQLMVDIGDHEAYVGDPTEADFRYLGGAGPYMSRSRHSPSTDSLVLPALKFAFNEHLIRILPWPKCGFSVSAR